MERDNTKSRNIILAISRLKHNANMEDYLPRIKEELQKADQSNGLLLLGLYCLESCEKVLMFLPLYWRHLNEEDIANNTKKSQLLVSLKVVTDFVVKFDLLRRDPLVEEAENYSPDLYLKNLLRLTLYGDPEVKILAIESLCRLMYHERVDESNVGYCFLYLLLLWWETGSE